MCNRWEWYAEDFWEVNLRRSNFIAQGDKCHDRGWNQALVEKFDSQNYKCTTFDEINNSNLTNKS